MWEWKSKRCDRRRRPASETGGEGTRHGRSSVSDSARRSLGKSGRYKNELMTWQRIDLHTRYWMCNAPHSCRCCRRTLPTRRPCNKRNKRESSVCRKVWETKVPHLFDALCKWSATADTTLSTARSNDNGQSEMFDLIFRGNRHTAMQYHQP